MGKPLEEIMNLKVWEGNRRKNLGDLFDIKVESEGVKDEIELHIIGDLRKVRMIGAEMTGGAIIIHGDVGMHVGEGMTGGSIIVHGDADSWAGCMMKGGKIEIHGSAGDYLAAPYRGSRRGMTGGSIIVHGDVGNEAGLYMRGGTIKIHGDAGEFAGIHMRGGEILVLGDSHGRPGASMIKGKIAICGHVSSMLPTFTIEDLREKVKICGERIEGQFYLFEGDHAEGGSGRLYISRDRNPQLRSYERYL